ncbi:MAG TPA: FGGY family carbohydrate kinase [Phycisphaerae bacterium]|nr:FGGY family carbohydrate kinase [Phycisphaerae bacterium]
MRILALDSGSSSVKAGYWDGCRFAARAKAAYPTHFDGPRVEVDPTRLLSALAKAAREATAGRGAVDIIAYGTFSSGVIVTDPAGRPRTPIITHQDRRSTDTARQLLARLPKRTWLSRLGNLPYPGGIGASTLAWLAQHQPALLKNDARAGQLSSLIAHHLTGQWVIDPSNAVFLGLCRITDFSWDPAACHAVGIRPASLPRLAWADEISGRLTPAAARRLGLTPGTPVTGGFVDTSAAVIQTPMRPGQLSHNAGSTDVLALSLTSPAPAEGILTRPVGVGRPNGPFATRATWLAVRTIAAAGSATAWARRELFRDLSDPQWFAALRRACRTAASSPPDPLAPRCLPAFAGDRAAIPAPDAPIGAAFDRITLSATRDQFLQAILRGLLSESRHNIEMLANLHPLQKRVYEMGGASDLAAAMHAAWNSPRQHHTFTRLPGDGIRGLVHLAESL